MNDSTHVARYAHLDGRGGLAAGDLACERDGGIDAQRFRTVIPSVPVDVGEPNEAVNQMVASLPLVTASVGRHEAFYARFGRLALSSGST
jgi:hypothetical protein